MLTSIYAYFDIMEAGEGWGVDVAKHLFNSKQVNINLFITG